MPKPFAESAAAASGAPAGPDKGKILREAPTLLGWICDTQYDDGTPLGKTKLSITRDGSYVLAELKVQDGGGRKIAVREKNPDKALAALEALLSAEVVPWQHDDYPIGGKGRKKK